MTLNENDERWAHLFDEAMVLRDDGRLVEARNKLSELIDQLQGTSSRLLMHAHLQLGHAFSNDRLYGDAATHLRIAVDLAPLHELASLTLFHVLLRAGEVAAALKESIRLLSSRNSLAYRELFDGNGFSDDLAPRERALAQEARALLDQHRAAQHARGALAVRDVVRIASEAPDHAGRRAFVRAIHDDEAELEFGDGERARVSTRFVVHD